MSIISVGRLRALVLLSTATALTGLPREASAKNPEEPETAPRPGNDITFLDHGRNEPYWFGVEANSIAQFNPPFSAPYSGMNSLQPDGAGGHLGVAHGLHGVPADPNHRDHPRRRDGARQRALERARHRGFPNLDVGAEPVAAARSLRRALRDPPAHPAVGRLGGEHRPGADLRPSPYVPRHRLEIRVGKMSTADLFDINPAGSDSHLQFMNWTRRQQRRLRLRRRHARLHLRARRRIPGAVSSRRATARC